MNKIEHLKMIQEIIGRFSHNSFMIKSWSITLLTGIIALNFGEVMVIDTNGFIILNIGVIISFYLIDCYYLYLERSYRMLYKIVSEIDEDKVDFRMNTKKKKLKEYADIKNIKNFEITLYTVFISPAMLIYLVEFIISVLLCSKL